MSHNARAERARGHASGGIRVLLLEPHRLVAEALAATLEADPGIGAVHVGGDPVAAAAIARRVAPDVAVVDHAPGHLDAALAAAALRGALPGLTVVVLAPEVGEELRLACARAGAAACLTRDRAAGLADLLKRVGAGARLPD
jgi:two-component system response regulator DesR